MCHLEGEILQDDYIKVAMLKLSENSGYGGPSISITQRLQEFDEEAQYESLIREHGSSILEKESTLSP